MNKTLTIILAGGHGTRLKPLTDVRTKPAVPFGGKYRIIDFTLNNCLHSGLRQILVLTQYKSFSLQKHLRDGWSIFNPELGEFITQVPPQMQVGKRWYAGTADAVYQNLNLLERSDAENVIILSGDHIYRMDYAAMIEYHKFKGAGMTLACMDVPLDEAKQFGVMEIDNDSRIVSFHEKPEYPVYMPENQQRAMVSMGIYVFSKNLLQQLLIEDAANELSSHDFGYDIVTNLIDVGNVYAYNFGLKEGRVTPDRYWRDVGTIDSYYEANMALLEPVPRLDLYQPDWPIRTCQIQYPPARTVPAENGSEGSFINSMMAGGGVIVGGNIQHSILFPHVYVDENAQVNESILFNNVKVGAGASLHKCIVDKDVDIPESIKIGFDHNEDIKRFSISEKGVVVVPKGYVFN